MRREGRWCGACVLALVFLILAVALLWVLLVLVEFRR